MRDHDLPGKPLVCSRESTEPLRTHGEGVVRAPVLVALDRLNVMAPVLDGYVRDDWKHWTDEDHDCQDTRQEVLIAESEIPVTFKTARNCKVQTGRWTCPYTGEVFTNPGSLDVDHMVPLGAAYAAGGHAWDAERRRAFANELGVAHHLIAVKASVNRSKGKHGPGRWLPPDEGYVCEYVRTWIDIKATWDLAVSPREKATLRKVSSRCSTGSDVIEHN